LAEDVVANSGSKAFVGLALACVLAVFFYPVASGPYSAVRDLTALALREEAPQSAACNVSS
jgi:hypothetical protein